MRPDSFYQRMWDVYQDTPPDEKRDWLHRVILDRIFDPWANNRSTVALRQLGGGHRLLDIGCWDGGFALRAQEQGLFREVYGVDLVEDAVAIAKKRGVTAYVADLNTEPLPFEAEFFDAVTMLAVLEHVFDPYFAVAEAHRVLKPGGEFIVAVPNVASASNRLRILRGRIPVTSIDPGWDGGHLHYFTPYDLTRLLTESGFNVVARNATGGRPCLREWWLSLLSGEFVVKAIRGSAGSYNV